jgi:prepilin-type N-terminal cleavage/methylation domain-containing protein
MNTDHVMTSVRRARSGFTLLELLAAMGILVVIVLLMARIYADASTAWTRGTKRVYESQEGRAIMDFLSQEMSQIIADDVVSFRSHSTPGPDSMSVQTYGLDTDSVCFVAATRPPPYSSMRRSTPQFIYYVDFMEDPVTRERLDENHPEGPRYALYRIRKTASTHSSVDNLAEGAHQNPRWWDPQYWDAQINFRQWEVIAENVAGFEVWCAKGSVLEAGNTDPNDYYRFNYASVTEGEPPIWIDVYLMLLGEAEAIQAAALWRENNPTAEDFIDRNTRRYTTRIYLRNREGYTR